MLNTNKKILHLGCGLKPYKPKEGEEVLHLDKLELPEVEIVCDLNNGIPLPSGQFDEVIAFDIVEHILDVFKLMEEIHRVLKPDGIVKIHTTYIGTEMSFTDPSHYHYFTLDSFDYFDFSTGFGKGYGFYTKAKFKILKKAVEGGWLVFEMQVIK